MEYKNNQIKIKDSLQHEETWVESAQFIKYFELPYINTVHSSQGITINEDYIIAEVNHYFVNWKWIYVAITRSTSLDNIKILTCENQLNKNYVEQ